MEGTTGHQIVLNPPQVVTGKGVLTTLYCVFCVEAVYNHVNYPLLFFIEMLIQHSNQEEGCHLPQV